MAVSWLIYSHIASIDWLSFADIFNNEIATAAPSNSNTIETVVEVGIPKELKISNSKKVLEIGTFTGLSALSIALALPDDGKLIALDKNEETNKIALDFFKKANQLHKIETIIKPALESLDDLTSYKFDMIFIDADKMNYKEYYERSLKLINKGGLIIIDNVLWHGEVVDESNIDKFTINIREFNDHVSNDKRVEQIIIPFGDGMTVCRVL